MPFDHVIITLMENVLDISLRQAFRDWLEEHYDAESECWIDVKKGKPVDEETFWYIDAVEEALCFGWIDSISLSVDGKRLQRFSPRKKRGYWTELNKARVRRLERLGLMTDAGRKTLPPLGPRSFKFDPDLVQELKKARVWSKFRSFPKLYQRVRAYNVSFYKKIDINQYEKSLAHLIEETRKGKMYGEWNDYGRLSDDE